MNKDHPAPQQAPAVQGQPDRAEFERQAKYQGGFDFTPAKHGYCENGWFPATYRDAMVELAWRVWANKRTPSPAVPPSDLTDAELSNPEFMRGYVEGCDESFTEAMEEIKRLRAINIQLNGELSTTRALLHAELQRKGDTK